MDEKIYKAIMDARAQAKDDMAKHLESGSKIYIADFIDTVFPDATTEQRLELYALINFWEANQTVIITGLALGHFTK